MSGITTCQVRPGRAPREVLRQTPSLASEQAARTQAFPQEPGRRCSGGRAGRLAAAGLEYIICLIRFEL